MGKTILIVLAVIVVAFVIVVTMQPADFRITRSATIGAPPATVFPHANDLHKWQDWSPWAKLDPACKVTFEGPEAGTGSTFRWAGNDKVGEGSMKITESKPAELVRYDLEFLKPFAAKNVAELAFKADGANTVVTWSMTGTNGFMGKAFGLIMDCDKMVGGDFEKGLASLKTIAEAKK